MDDEAPSNNNEDKASAGQKTCGQCGLHQTTTVTRPLQDKWPVDNNDNDDVGDG